MSYSLLDACATLALPEAEALADGPALVVDPVGPAVETECAGVDDISCS